MKALDRSLPVLVVDDSRLMCNVMGRVINQAGFPQWESATEGVDAILKLKSRPYGLLMTDLNMNPISGVDLIHSIRSDRHIGSIPIILTSANYQAMAKAIADSDRELADVYILKPFTAETLKGKLAAVFGDT